MFPTATMPWSEIETARILVVDDDPDNLRLVSRALEKVGCRQTFTVSDPFQAAAKYAEFLPDVVLLDYRMPPVDGFFVLEQLRALETHEPLAPVILFTGDASESIKQQALEAGVADFVRRDFDMTEMVLRTRNAIRAHRLLRQVQRQSEHLEEMVRIRTSELIRAQRETLERLALAAEYRDEQTSAHTRRVGELSAKIAERLECDEQFVRAIRDAAQLHDLGKIGVPDGILRKPGPLTPGEYDKLKEHTTIGGRILSGCTEPVLQMACQIAVSHHERWDGSGYPEGLRGEQIPLAGRIVAVADAYDAITSERTYKPPRPSGEAFEELRRESGLQFDPRVVAALMEALGSRSSAAASYAK